MPKSVDELKDRFVVTNQYLYGGLMSESKFAERKAQIRAEFNAADKEKQRLVDERSKLDRQLSLIAEKIIRLDAAYVELLNFEPDPKPEEKPAEEVKVPDSVTTH